MSTEVRIEVAHEFDPAPDADARLDDVVRILLGEDPLERPEVDAA